MAWNSLCALGFHSGRDMLSPENSGNEAMRPVVTREHSLALSAPLPLALAKCVSHLAISNLMVQGVRAYQSHVLVFLFLLFKVCLF